MKVRHGSYPTIIRESYLVQRTNDGVALGLIANRRMELSCSESREEGSESSLDKHDVDCLE